jgi:signal transduction histidine kinase/GAF domain-containing protein
VKAGKHSREEERLQALRSYKILDTAPEAAFDELVSLAAQICEAPVSVVTLVDEDRQWFKASVGVNQDTPPLEQSFCAHAVLEGAYMEVNDATSDVRFQNNPLVISDPGIRFYAGAVLHSDAGLPLGALCVLDVKPRELTDLQRTALKVLGRQVTTQLELRRTIDRLRAEEIERGRAEQNSMRVAEFLAVLTDSLPVGVAYLDIERRFQFVNGGFEREFGVKRKEIVDRRLNELLGDVARIWNPDSILAAMEGRSTVEEASVTYPIGERRVETYYLPDLDAMGRVKGLVIQTMNVSGRFAAQQVLAAERQEVDQTIANAEIATFNWDLPTKRITGNSLLARFFKLNEDDIGKHGIGALLRSIHSDDRPRISSTISEALAHGEPYEVEYRVTGAEDEERWVLARGNAYLDADQKPVRLTGVVLDMTRLRQAEAALKIEDEKLTSVIDFASSTIYLLKGPDFVFDVVNQAATQLFGNQPLVGRSMIDVLPDIDAQGFLAPLQEVFETRGHIRFSQVRLMAPRSSGVPEEVYLDLTFNALVDEKGSTYGIAVHGINVTETVRNRRRIERSNEELEVRVSERTRELQATVQEAIGFNYSIAHDLRSPLRAINSTAQILLAEASDNLSEDHVELLRRQAFNSKRLGLLVDDLLQLSRLSRVELVRSAFDMSGLVQEVLSELGVVRSPNLEFLVAEEMIGSGDPQHVRLVLGNLLENAIKFSPEGGVISIGQLTDRAPTVFFVKDEGIGFKPEYSSKIFLPFERLVTEEQFSGTGIGLANVKRIIDRHGGQIWSESAVGKGATFYFTLSG